MKTDGYKGMSLKEICESAGKDYNELLRICVSDCEESWSPESVITFEDYVKLHLVRVLGQIRHNPAELNLYC